jgi:hypothetical protein
LKEEEKVELYGQKECLWFYYPSLN